MPTIRKSLIFALDLLFPKECQGCGREGSYLCLPCQSGLAAPDQRCPVCGRGSLLGRVHDDCRDEDAALAGLLVSASYRKESVQNLIWYLKYHSVREIADTLSILLMDFLVSSDLLEYFDGCLVTAVPQHWWRRAGRGYNQAELLGRSLASRLGFAFQPALVRLKNVRRQTELPRAERLLNVAGNFGLSPAAPAVAGKKILLIDDVATTGATLNECAKVLREGGAAEIWGLVVARN